MTVKYPKYLGLVHHPVVNKKGEEVTTSVTNLDLHDIARLAKTFGVEKYFVMTPLAAQKDLLKKILDHWKGSYARKYNPDRHVALKTIQLVSSVEEAKQLIEEWEGVTPEVAVTAAKMQGNTLTCKELNCNLALDNNPLLLLFGTGWGLAKSVLEQANFRLAGISGASEDGYNHLSVRAAVAIYCDRLWGQVGH